MSDRVSPSFWFKRSSPLPRLQVTMSPASLTAAATPPRASTPVTVPDIVFTDQARVIPVMSPVPDAESVSASVSVSVSVSVSASGCCAGEPRCASGVQAIERRISKSELREGCTVSVIPGEVNPGRDGRRGQMA